MTSTPQPITGAGSDFMAAKARDHLWMAFTRLSHYYDGSGHVPVIVRGEGAYIWDDQGNRYLDGLAGLFTNQLGHGRKDIGAAMAKQAEELAFFPTWAYARTADALYVNLFVGSTIRVGKVGGTEVEVVQKTDYPGQGKVALTLNPTAPSRFSVHVRVPDSCVPSSGCTGWRPANAGVSSMSALVISTATGFKSLACVSRPSRWASRGIDPPPQNGSMMAGGPSG